MLKMDQYELIRTAHRVYGKGIREIANEYGHHRKTVRKALREAEQRVHNQAVKASPVMDKVKSLIDEWLQSDRKAPRKQRHTARRIYHRLVAEYSFTGGESTVRNYVGLRKRELCLGHCASMMPLCPVCGQEAEVDWGEAEVIIARKQIKAHLFCMRPRYSGKRFVRAYPNETQEMFLEGHQQGFEYFGGVFPTLVYDNLRTAVKKILRGRSREEQESFHAFRSHYTFTARFCNPGEGHEKGGVEGLVGYARRNFLVPLPEFESFAALNTFLLQQCEKHDQQTLIRDEQPQVIAALFAEEKKHLIPLPSSPYSIIRTITVKVDAYQTVCLERNHYSVPSRYVGLRLNASLSCWKITLFYQHTQVAQHQRLFGQHGWALDPFHYLESLKRKTGAFDQARPLQGWRQDWPNSYEKMLFELRESRGFSEGTRQFIGILQLHQKHPDQEVRAAVQLSVDSGCYGFESVKMLLDKQWSTQLSFPALGEDLLPGVTDLKVELPDLSQFNQLIA